MIRSVSAAMWASSVVGDDEKNGGLWCSPIANTSSPTSSVFCAIRTIASIRSASLGVSPDTGSRVMSLTEKIPNCMPAPALASQIYAFACISTAQRLGYSLMRKGAQPWRPSCSFTAPATAAGTGIWCRPGCRPGGTKRSPLTCRNDTASLDDYAYAVADVAGVASPRDLVIVGQSYGSFAATLAASRLGARMLVLLAGMIPAP